MDICQAIEKTAVVTWRVAAGQKGGVTSEFWRDAGWQFYGMRRVAMHVENDEAEAMAEFLTDIAFEIALMKSEP